MHANVSRRNLVAGSALGAASIAATTVFGWTKPQDAWAQTVGDDMTWDAEYDVVVIGLGGAGANAAVSAYEQGAKVLVCEKSPEGWEPANTKAAGQVIQCTDDADGLYTYLSELMGKFENYDEECLRTFCEGAAGNWDWAVNTLGMDPEVACPSAEADQPQGTPYTWDYVDDAWGMGRKGWVATYDEFPELDGHEHCKGLLVTGKLMDSGYYNLCMAAVNDRKGDNLEVWKGTAGKRLLLDAEGAVAGIVVERDGEELSIKANGGVCLCCGGFENNREMISDYCQMPSVNLKCGTMNTGEGVKMAQAAGASLWHMSNVAGWQWSYQSPFLSTSQSLGTNYVPKGLYVGTSGARFVNEVASNRHGRISIGGRWCMPPIPVPTYYVTDSTSMGEAMLPGFSADNSLELSTGEIIQGATLAELADNIRAVGEAPDFNLNGEFEKAVEKYNAHCHANDGAGEEDDFGRMCTVAVEAGPFYAAKVGPTMFNTMGGPRRNFEAQVINTEGMPIEGLFCAGELGSIFADMYNGGGNLSETMVFGRIAGKNAALRASGEFQGATEPATTIADAADVVRAADTLATTVDFSQVADGTYDGNARGYAGPMTIEVTVEGGKVVSCEATVNNESANYGGPVLPFYCDALVEAQDLAGIDCIGGASNTLRAFKLAVKRACEQQ